LLAQGHYAMVPSQDSNPLMLSYAIPNYSNNMNAYNNNASMSYYRNTSNQLYGSLHVC